MPAIHFTPFRHGRLPPTHVSTIYRRWKQNSQISWKSLSPRLCHAIVAACYEGGHSITQHQRDCGVPLFLPTEIQAPCLRFPSRTPPTLSDRVGSIESRLNPSNCRIYPPLWGLPWYSSQFSFIQKLLPPKIPTKHRQPKGYRWRWSSDSPQQCLRWPSDEVFSLGMAQDLVLLWKPWAQPPPIRRLPPQVLGDFAQRVECRWSPPSCCSDKQDQRFKTTWPNWSLHGHPLASLRSHSPEEASPPGVGIPRTPGSDMGNHRQDYPRPPCDAFGRNVVKYQQLTDWWVGALLPYRGRKGPSKAPSSWFIPSFLECISCISGCKP
jgi:hypothetical protein